MNKPQSPPADTFLYRLFAATSCGIAVITAGFAANLALQRIPTLQRAAENYVGLHSVGRAGDFVFEHPYWPLIAASLALIASVVAFATIRKSAMAVALICNFGAMGLTLAAEVAMSRVWTRMLTTTVSTITP